MEKDASPQSSPTNPNSASGDSPLSHEAPGTIERFGTALDSVRRWSTMVWRISALMAKGAYLVGERQRLFQQLGEKVYERIQKGEIKDKDWEALVHQLDRLTKKIEIEEILIRGLRFGTSSRQAREDAAGT